MPVGYVETGEVKTIILVEAKEIKSLFPATFRRFAPNSVSQMCRQWRSVFLLVKISVGKTVIFLRFYIKLYNYVFRKTVWHFERKKHVACVCVLRHVSIIFNLPCTNTTKLCLISLRPHLLLHELFKIFRYNMKFSYAH